MKTLKDFDVKGKRVLVRCDFNVPKDKDGKIVDDFRISQTIPTIKYLADNKAKVILMSHFGDPKGKRDENFSLAPARELLSELLKIPIDFIDDCVGDKVKSKVNSMQDGEILLLENLRFHSEEEENNPDFAKQLAELGEIYINDAFSACHRKHASIFGITKYLPSGAGMLLEKEINVLSKVLDNPWRPLTAIIGGAKISSKSKVIKKFIENADNLLIGGKVANTILVLKGILVRNLPEEEQAKDIGDIELTSTKLHLPVDAVASPNNTGDIYVRASAPGTVRNDELLLDIGPETINMFSEIIKQSKMIIWSGPMGYFENPKFSEGTKEIANVIVKNHEAYKIAGGGDTIAALSKFNVLNKFDHVSTGGSAMLEFLSGEKLPGIEALK